VSYAQSPDQLLASNVAGFVLVTDVDVARGSLTLLAPCAGPLPGRYLIAGSQTAFLT
jgi:polyribonucleotide 5'-hydroxyl-kinase